MRSRPACSILSSANVPTFYAHLQSLRSSRRGSQLDDPAVASGQAQTASRPRLSPAARPLLLLRVHPIRSVDRSAEADQPRHWSNVASASLIPAPAVSPAARLLGALARPAPAEFAAQCRSGGGAGRQDPFRSSSGPSSLFAETDSSNSPSSIRRSCPRAGPHPLTPQRWRPSTGRQAARALTAGAMRPQTQSPV